MESGGQQKKDIAFLFIALLSVLIEILESLSILNQLLYV